jgi:hypothetical protein
MSGIPVFWLEPTDQQRVWLRRHRSGPCGDRGEYAFHNAMALKFDSVPLSLPLRGDLNSLSETRPDGWTPVAISEDDPLWPTRCEHCGCGFSPTEDAKQVFANTLYRGAPDGTLYTLQEAPVGAMWDASWYRSRDDSGDWYTGPDGLSLVVKTPGGEWCVDGEASNCTRTQYGPKEIDGVRHEKVWLGRTHDCWVRHGDPRNPATLHVDKHGNTCEAGAGSIQQETWHGFLHHGHLITA